jgi:16S rRNA processing protein RimM
VSQLPLGLEPDTLPDDAVEVGRIAEAWGIQGWFKVHAYSASAEALFSCKRWYICPPEPQGVKRVMATSQPVVGLLRIIQAKVHSSGPVAKAEVTPDRTAAEQLKGWRIHVPRSSFPTPEDNAYYWVDLIGLEVVNREGVALGKVVELLSTGPHDVLVLHAPVAGADHPLERLIPFVKAYIDDVDRSLGRITVDWQSDY